MFSTIQAKLSPETPRHKGTEKDENKESKDLLVFLIESDPPSSLCRCGDFVFLASC